MNREIRRTITTLLIYFTLAGEPYGVPDVPEPIPTVLVDPTAGLKRYAHWFGDGYIVWPPSVYFAAARN
ncbi:MAG: hypothetical protein JSW52_00760 [Candidatus Coatesbacteria bacterium]|nr:MAG: hypothetical protein JSW52_00760 [Candidatus Coatesbacteria bacterium]